VRQCCGGPQGRTFVGWVAGLRITPLALGDRAHRAPADARQSGDLPLAEPAFRQQTANLFDLGRGEHGNDLQQ